MGYIIEGTKLIIDPYIFKQVLFYDPKKVYGYVKLIGYKTLYKVHYSDDVDNNYIVMCSRYMEDDKELPNHFINFKEELIECYYEIE
jgi:hypothetical protein